MTLSFFLLGDERPAALPLDERLAVGADLQNAAANVLRLADLLLMHFQEQLEIGDGHERHGLKILAGGNRISPEGRVLSMPAEGVAEELGRLAGVLHADDSGQINDVRQVLLDAGNRHDGDGLQILCR